MPYRVILLLIVLVGLAGCSKKNGQASDQSTSPSSSEKMTDMIPESSSVSVADDAYPLDYCVVSGEKLGAMGPAFVMQVQGHVVKLCCPACKPKVLADPDMYLAKIDAAAHKPMIEMHEAPSNTHHQMHE